MIPAMFPQLNLELGRASSLSAFHSQLSMGNHQPLAVPLQAVKGEPHPDASALLLQHSFVILFENIALFYGGMVSLFRCFYARCGYKSKLPSEDPTLRTPDTICPLSPTKGFQTTVKHEGANQHLLPLNNSSPFVAGRDISYKSFATSRDQRWGFFSPPSPPPPRGTVPQSGGIKQF